MHWFRILAEPPLTLPFCAMDCLPLIPKAPRWAHTAPWSRPLPCAPLVWVGIVRFILSHRVCRAASHWAHAVCCPYPLLQRLTPTSFMLPWTPSCAARCLGIMMLVLYAA